MRSNAKILALLCTVAVGAGVALPSFAEEARPASAGDHPERGMRMNLVETRFGAPASRYPAVGKPPISRWDYPGFVVYFENDLVLHAVVVTQAG